MSFGVQFSWVDDVIFLPDPFGLLKLSTYQHCHSWSRLTQRLDNSNFWFDGRNRSLKKKASVEITVKTAWKIFLPLVVKKLTFKMFLMTTPVRNWLYSLAVKVIIPSIPPKNYLEIFNNDIIIIWISRLV